MDGHTNREREKRRNTLWEMARKCVRNKTVVTIFEERTLEIPPIKICKRCSQEKINAKKKKKESNILDNE